MTRALVVQTAWLGDVLLTTPLLEALAARYGAVDVLVTPEAAPLLDPHPAVAAVLTYDKRGHDRGVGALWRKARALRARRYDLAVLEMSELSEKLVEAEKAQVLFEPDAEEPPAPTSERPA